jgi:hypothetical protein
MRRRGLVALIALSIFSAPALASRVMQLALPSQLPEDPPQRPVGDPDVPPVNIDLFDSGSSREEAWPWPLLPTDN